eukprot:6199442-Pleurochrysis_carterae.AAC.1
MAWDTYAQSEYLCILELLAKVAEPITVASFASPLWSGLWLQDVVSMTDNCILARGTAIGILAHDLVDQKCMCMHMSESCAWHRHALNQYMQFGTLPSAILLWAGSVVVFMTAPSSLG